MENNKKLSVRNTPDLTTTPEETKDEVSALIDAMQLSDMLPTYFDSLTEAQKLKTVRDLKQRIVDLAREDGQTQYSEYMRGKNFLGKITSSFKKESDIRRFEKEAFRKIKESDEGKDLLADNLGLLAMNNKSKDIILDTEGNPVVTFLNQEDPKLTQEEKRAIEEFNSEANNFSNLPYEWGQGAGKQRKDYDLAREKYDIAMKKVLTLQSGKERLDDATARILQINNSVQMEQLVHTHPEFEKVLNDFSKDDSAVKTLQTQTIGLFKKITGEKGANRQLFALGVGTRMLTTAVLGGVAAPVVGAVIGGLRGRLKGMQTLVERSINSRYGKKDTSAEARNTVDAEILNSKLNKLIKKYFDAKIDTPEREKIMDMLRVRIKYTQDKLESGLVNFGDKKQSLGNQTTLIDNLNYALVKANMEASRDQIDQRLEEFLNSRQIKIESAQKSFIKKQMFQGAMLGAGAATAGYVLRYAGEHFGWWGHHTDGIQNGGPKTGQTIPRPTHGPKITAPAATETTTPGVGEGPMTESISNPTTDKVPTGVSANPEISHEVNLDKDVVKQGEGIESAFIRQIEKSTELAKSLGYKEGTEDLHKFAGRMAHRIALENGYVNGTTGEEIYVKNAGEAAYKLIPTEEMGHASVQEFHKEGTEFVAQKLHNPGEAFEEKPDAYEMRHDRTVLPTDKTPEVPATPSETLAQSAVYDQNRLATAGEIQQSLEGLGFTGDPTNENEGLEHLKSIGYHNPGEAIRGAELHKGIEDALDSASQTTAPKTETIAEMLPIFKENMYNLQTPILRTINEIHLTNLKKLFPENTVGFRTSLEKIKFDEFNETFNPNGQVAQYVKTLQQVTGEKPKMGIFGLFNKETVGHYIARALQYAGTKPGMLDKLKLK